MSAITSTTWKNSLGMRELTLTLFDYDPELIRVIANRWDVDVDPHDPRLAAQQLAAAMLQPERSADAWARLTDDQRGAMQTLLGAGGRMPSAVFSRLYGEIRPMGPGRLEREKPYLNPVSITEALYYRGLIAMTFGEGVKGASQAFTYIPTNLIPLLPAHQTGYNLTAEPEHVESLPQPDNIRLADTALVDDLTTVLAYCRINDVPLADGEIDPNHRQALKPHLLGSSSNARFALMTALASGLGIAAESGGFFRPVPANAAKWLDLPRSQQVQTMADAWRDSILYNELWHTPGLKPERAGWQNDPLLARQTVLTFLELVPPDAWWPVETFIASVKEDEPDFQRPNADYDSWYIRDAKTGQYLRGFDTWDKVDGAVLRFILTGPMHGLGLIDTGQNGEACRLTAYGRAFTGIADWPPAPSENPPFTVQSDGQCEVSRAVSRYDRFQLARFTEWLQAGDPYRYRLSAAGLAQAQRQHIEANHILTFLKRGTGDKVPESIVQLVTTWGQAEAPAVLSQMIVLRLPSEELLDTIWQTPAIRRYLGAVLGPQAVAVRDDQWNELVAALQSNGIVVEIDVQDEASE